MSILIDHCQTAGRILRASCFIPEGTILGSLQGLPDIGTHPDAIKTVQGTALRIINDFKWMLPHEQHNTILNAQYQVVAKRDIQVGEPLTRNI